MGSSENVACFSLISPTDAKMFADSNRRASRTEGKNKCMELRNKERGSKREWGEAEMNEWKCRKS